MKNCLYQITLLVFGAHLFAALLPVPGVCQNFQKHYGTPLDNSFHKVIKDGTNYYVLGQDEPVDGGLHRATVTRLDANGVHQWTLSLNIASVWNDAVLTPAGDLLVVGNTLPFDPTAKSLMARVTPLGAFAWLRSYDEPGRDLFSRIVRNPVPQNPAFPYYVLGGQIQPGASPTTEDVVLLNLDGNGVFNWKKIYLSPADDEFFRDLDVLPGTGDLLLAGNSTGGLIFMTNNAGTMLNGVEIAQRVYRDVAPAGLGGLYAAATFGASSAYVQKLDQNLLLQWEVEILELNIVSQVWETLPGVIYVTGIGTFGGQGRTVIVKMTDTGTPTIDWVKYLDAGSGFTGGSSWFLPPLQLAFTDARILPGGFGQTCAFASVSDLDLNTCMVSQDNASLLFIDPVPNAPALLAVEMPPVPQGINLLEAQALNWQQDLVCNPDPCSVVIDIKALDNCGLVQVCANATGAGPFSYQWCDGQTSQCFTQQLSCGPHDFCVSVTCSDGTVATASATYVVTDFVPPVALCLGVGVVLDANCEATITPALIDGGSFDDCLIVNMSVNPGVVTGCGLHPVTLTVEDWCGNVSKCAASVQAIETDPPVLTGCPQNITVAGSINALGVCVASVQVASPSASDLCSPPVTLTNSFNGTANASGTYPQGTTTVTWTATDDCGNEATCSFTVTVECQVDSSIFDCGQAVITCYSGANPNGYVMGVIDVRDYANQATVGNNWNAPMYHHPDWTRAKMGEIFGIAIDKDQNIYVTATKAYNMFNNPGPIGTAGNGGIYKISALNGSVSNFVTTENVIVTNTVGTKKIPNGFSTGPGLGNICYDRPNLQFFVTNLEDGKIYRIAAPGNVNDPVGGEVLSVYDPFAPWGGTAGLECKGELAMGVGIFANRVYFGVWNNDGSNSGSNPNRIYSIALDGSGNFTGSHLLEITIPSFNSTFYGNITNPITDIEFSHAGRMLVAERSLYSVTSPSCNGWNNAHASRVLEFMGASGSWNPVPKVFYIGNYNPPQHANAAGGVDYGYQGIDQTTGDVFGCDSMVWATGDALRLDYIAVYGIAGIASSGNAPSPNLNSYYVDADGDILSGDKTFIGDVDIFKCGCPDMGDMPPCDPELLMAMPHKIPPTDSCCWALDMKIQIPGICRIEFEILTPGVIFNQFSSVPWIITPNTLNPNTQISVTNPPGDIPVGTYLDAVEFCLTNIKNLSQVPQMVVVRYYRTTAVGEILLCKDTLVFDCPPPLMNNGCWSAVVDTVYCNPDSMSYTIKVTITNEDDNDSYDYLGILNTAPAACFTLTSPPIMPFTNPLAPGQSEQVCLMVDANKFILDTTNVYFQFFLFSDHACCHATDSLCVPLPPCCTPCENVSVVVDSLVSQFDSCCYTLDVSNTCAKDYFKRIETTIITPGVTFSQAQVVSTLPYVWYSPFGTDTEIHWAFQGGNIPIGHFDDLITFCLTDINDASQYPQCVEVKWIACTDTGEDTVVCRDTLKFYCPPVKRDTCVEVVERDIKCLPDGSYQFNYTIQNVSSHFASHFSIYQKMPPSVTITPFPFITNVSLNPGDTYSGSMNIAGGAAGDTVKLKVRLFDFTPPLPNVPYDTAWCCFDTICIVLPPCDTCICLKDISLYQGGAVYPVFCDPHMGFIPALPCPADDVIVSGFIGCFNPIAGQPCDPTPVIWEFIQPDGTTHSGSTTNSFTLLFPKTDVDDPGLYCVILSTICPGSSDTCICKVTWIQEPCPDSCCIDFNAFCQAVEKATTLSIDSSKCKVTLNIGDLPCDDYLEWVNWGDGHQDFGPFTSGSMPMHTYAGSGTYVISYLAIELNDNGLICFEKILSDTINVKCDSCCLDFDAFCQAVEKATTLSIDSSKCKVTLNIGDLPCDDYLEWVNWGDGHQDFGPFTSGSMPMHTYAGSGTYVISYLAIELNDNGLICFEKILSDTINVKCDSCCLDFDAFCQAVEKATTLSIDAKKCKVTLNIGDLPCDDYLEWVNWGDGHQDFGPFTSGSMPMHTYATSGTYVISYLAIELNNNGLICFEKILKDTIDLKCDSCYCGKFDKLFFRWGKGLAKSKQVFCDSQTVFIPCPTPGKSLQFSGAFKCDGPNCPPTAPVSWVLVRLPSTTVASGSTTANPYFGIPILPTWYGTPGNYELRLTGLCGSDKCECKVRFTMDCTNTCPCDTVQFAKDVNNGFAQVLSSLTCKACFAPTSLNDCDMVSWHIGSVNTPPVGMTIGNQNFCHTFPGSGTYTVIMVVTRKKSDGSICAVATKSQTVKVVCTALPACDVSVFKNAGFSQGAVSGVLGAGGASANWTASAGEPRVVEGSPGSFDAWTISLSGNFDASDGLTPSEPLCLARDTGTITIRARTDRGDRDRPCDIMVVGFEKDIALSLERAAAMIELTSIDSGAWVDIVIPFDLSDFPEVDSCGNPMLGAQVQPVVYVTNALGDEQGGTDTRSSAEIDYFCFNGKLFTAVKDLHGEGAFQLFPNPTTGELILRLKDVTLKAGKVQILDLYGRVVKTEWLPGGRQEHVFSVASMPAGVYFVKVLDEGVPVWVQRIVKQ